MSGAGPCLPAQPGGSTDSPLHFNSLGASGRPPGNAKRRVKEAAETAQVARDVATRQMHVMWPPDALPTVLCSSQHPPIQSQTDGTRGPGAPGTAAPEESFSFSSRPQEIRSCQAGGVRETRRRPPRWPLPRLVLDAWRQAALPRSTGDPDNKGM